MLSEGSFQPSPIALGLAAGLLFFFVLNFVLSDPVSKLGLVTGNTLIANTYVWNLVTSCFYETQVAKLIGDVLALVVVSRSLRIVGGAEQFGLYVVFCILACTLGTSAYCYIRFFATGLEEMLMEPIYGFGGVFICILMFLRRQNKDEAIYFAVPQVTYQNLPIIVIATQCFFWLVGLRSFALDLPFSFIGLFFSWSYLRFFYRFDDGSGALLSTEAGAVTAAGGDKADDFSFVSMFPEALHIVAIPLSTAFYNIFSLVGIFPELEVVAASDKKLSHHLRYTDNASKPSESPLLAPQRQDLVQERRRAKALKLLDAKMAELAKEPEGWEGDEGVEIGGGGGGLGGGGGGLGASKSATIELSSLKV